jgi:hypothetical protein
VTYNIADICVGTVDDDENSIALFMDNCDIFHHEIRNESFKLLILSKQHSRFEIVESVCILPEGEVIVYFL